MNYTQFSQLWDALVTNRPKIAGIVPITNGMEDDTATALIAYGSGDKSTIESVRDFLKSAPAI